MSDNKAKSSLSVSNLVNLSNLERVFGEIFDKLSTITTRLDKLENELASNVSLTRFLSLKNEYESFTNLFENRVKYLEENVSELKPIITKSQFNQENIDKIREKSKQFITNESFESSINDFECTMTDKLEQISSNKCGIDRCKKLEESTKIISQQISAMESMLQCKVDKSQVPLIESCQKQLDVTFIKHSLHQSPKKKKKNIQSLERFRDKISQRVCIVDDQISDITNDVNSKLNQDTFQNALSFIFFFVFLAKNDYFIRKYFFFFFWFL